MRKAKNPTFSMRAFVFNFEKSARDAEKVPYILSERAALERKISLKHAVTNYFVKEREGDVS